MIILDSLFTKGPTLSSQLTRSNIFFVSNKRQLKRPFVPVRCYLQGVRVAEPALVHKALCPAQWDTAGSSLWRLSILMWKNAVTVLYLKIKGNLNRRMEGAGNQSQCLQGFIQHMEDTNLKKATSVTLCNFTKFYLTESSTDYI